MNEPQRVQLHPKKFDASEWMSMDSAPHDGTPVLIQGPSAADWPFIAYWGNPYRQFKRGHEAWIGHESGLHADADCIGWRPLP